MKTRISVLLLALWSCSPAFGDQSADGVGFPDAPKSLFQAALPIIGNRLGGKIGEMGRVLNGKKSADIIAKRIKGSEFNCEWFVIGFAGADAGGFDLTDGRVTRIVLYYNQASPIRAQDTVRRMNQIGRGTKPNECVPKNKLGNDVPVHADIGTTQITFNVDAVEWNLLYHQASLDIAKAMRSRLPLQGMSEEQAIATFGKPQSVEELGNGELSMLWEEREPITDDPSPSVVSSARDSYFNLQGSILSPQKIRTRLSRRVVMVFDKEKRTAFQVNDDDFRKK